MQHTYIRWIFSPLENVADPTGTLKEGFQYPIARYYAMHWRAPMHHEGAALVRCELGAGQLAKAKQDTRLTVLDSESIVPANVIAHHQSLGVKQGATLREMLKSISQYHSLFEPE